MHDLDVFLLLVAVAAFFAAGIVALVGKGYVAALFALGLLAAFLVPLIALIRA